jgi:tripartite-type tricarboxylate transporter receptor subunit TctC
MPQLEQSPYRGITGFAFVCNYGTFTQPVVVRADAPYQSWKEVVEYAKQHPGKIKIGVVGSRSRSPQGFALWDAEQAEGVKFDYLVFKSGKESLNAILGGHISVDATATSPTLIQYFQQGKLKPIGYLSEYKAKGYDAPTFKVLYGSVNCSIGAIWGPAGIPDPILDKLDKAFSQAVKDPTFVSVMNRMHMPIIYMNRFEITKAVYDTYPKVGEKLRILRAQEKK